MPQAQPGCLGANVGQSSAPQLWGVWGITLLPPAPLLFPWPWDTGQRVMLRPRSVLCRVVLSVNDKWHYCQNSDILVGSRAMRDRHLQLLGYCLVQVRGLELGRLGWPRGPLSRVQELGGCPAGWRVVIRGQCVGRSVPEGVGQRGLCLTALEVRLWGAMVTVTHCQATTLRTVLCVAGRTCGPERLSRGCCPSLPHDNLLTTGPQSSAPPLLAALLCQRG